MPITPPPPTPSRTNPLTFSPRMDATLAWFPTFVTDYNNDAALMGRRYVTYGGTANAITLTGALPAGASSIPVGTQVRFRATAANTGATTINLDGVGAVACRTITGVALPSGYIRTDVDTIASFDGTYWVLDRQIERGVNANGNFFRLADGTQSCRARIAGSSSGAVTWTFPAAFVNNTDTYVVGSGHATAARSVVTTATTTTGIDFSVFDTSGARTTSLANLQADGLWY